MRRIRNLLLISTGLTLVSGCILMREKTYVRQADGTLVQVDERVSVDPESPLGSLPYGPVALAALGLASAGYNEWKKRKLHKKNKAIMIGVDELDLDDESKNKLRLAHKGMGVYNEIKRDLKKLRS